MSPRMLVFPDRRVQIVAKTIVVWCDCGAYCEPVVKLEPGADTVEGLPATCPKCGVMIDTYATNRDAIDTARFMVEHPLAS